MFFAIFFLALPGITWVFSGQAWFGWEKGKGGGGRGWGEGGGGRHHLLSHQLLIVFLLDSRAGALFARADLWIQVQGPTNRDIFIFISQKIIFYPNKILKKYCFKSTIDCLQICKIIQQNLESSNISLVGFSKTQRMRRLTMYFPPQNQLTWTQLTNIQSTIIHVKLFRVYCTV